MIAVAVIVMSVIAMVIVVPVGLEATVWWWGSFPAPR